MEKASTRRLDLILDINKLKKFLFGCSAMEIAIHTVPITLNYYPYYKNNTDLVVWDNNEGEFFKVMFNQNGAIIVGFDHESELSPYSFEPLRLYDENLIKDVPESLKDIFDIIFDDFETLKYQMTFCIWREYTDDGWKIGNLDYDIIHNYQNNWSNDGSEELIFFFDGKYESYTKWINLHYGEDFVRNVTLETFQYFIENKAVTPEFIESLKQDYPYAKNIQLAITNLKKIGYLVEE